MAVLFYGIGENPHAMLLSMRLKINKYINLSIFVEIMEKLEAWCFYRMMAGFSNMI